MLLSVPTAKVAAFKDRYPEAYQKLYQFVLPQLYTPLTVDDLAAYLSIGKLIEIIESNKKPTSGRMSIDISIYKNLEYEWNVVIEYSTRVKDKELVIALWYMLCELLITGNGKEFTYH